MSDFILGSISMAFVFWMLIILKYKFKTKEKEVIQRKITISDIPDSVIKSFKERNPTFSEEQIDLIKEGLVDFFNLKNFRDEIKTSKTKGDFKLDMQSKAVDMLWHEFILHTNEYRLFNEKFFRNFLDHKPHLNLSKEDSEKIEKEMSDLLKYAIVKGKISEKTKLLDIDEIVLGETNQRYAKTKEEISQSLSIWQGAFLVAFAGMYIQNEKSGSGDAGSSPINTTTSSSNSSSDACSGCGD